MSILDAAAYAIGETVAYVVGRVVGRTFHLSPKKAKAIGDYFVIGVIVSAAILITVIYS